MRHCAVPAVTRAAGEQGAATHVPLSGPTETVQSGTPGIRVSFLTTVGISQARMGRSHNELRFKVVLIETAEDSTKIGTGERTVVIILSLDNGDKGLRVPGFARDDSR